jgi:hypothetical protein
MVLADLTERVDVYGGGVTAPTSGRLIKRTLTDARPGLPLHALALAAERARSRLGRHFELGLIVPGTADDGGWMR